MICKEIISLPQNMEEEEEEEEEEGAQQQQQKNEVELGWETPHSLPRWM